MLKIVLSIYVLIVTSCSLQGTPDSIVGGETNIEAGFRMSNLDNDLEVRVYELYYVDAVSVFLALRPYLPRETTLQFVPNKNLLVYADQPQRINKFEELIDFLDAPFSNTLGLDKERTSKLGKLIIESRSIPFYLGRDTFRDNFTATSNFITSIDGDDYDKNFGQHFERWFSSCIELKVVGRVHEDNMSGLNSQVVKLYVAKSSCVDSMNSFMSYLRAHDSTGTHENLVKFSIRGKDSKIKAQLKELYPELYEWKTPRGIPKL